MKIVEVMKLLMMWDARGRDVFTTDDLRVMIPERSPKTFEAGLRRLASQGILRRVARGVYVNPLSRISDGWRLERIAICLRRGEYSYVSLESALSEFGVISQVPIDWIGVMTTGRGGLFSTPYGRIEFTHTARSTDNVLRGSLAVEGRPLRIARVEVALRDLRRVGRNLHLVDDGIYRELLEEQRAGQWGVSA